MNHYNLQQQADISTSFSAFADINNNENLFNLEAQGSFTIEKHASFGEFASPEDPFPG